jgi:hypothetical protein
MVKKIDELEFRGTRWDPVRITEDDAGIKIDNFTKKLVRIKGEEELVNFRLKIIRNLVKQLESISARKTYALEKYLKEGSSKPLRLQIIDAILKDNSVEGANVVEGADGKLTMRIYLNHDLAVALNDGTGVYGREGKEIVPKEKTYMFIPGGQYAKGYFMRKYEKMGLSAADAKGRYEYGMEHNNLTRRKALKT